MGLPCPNLGYGGYQPHGETEHVSVEKMRLAAEILLKITESFVSEPPPMPESMIHAPIN
jgi:tripeptide aminopeptidase